jgi:ATP-dependent Zn protease
MTPEMTPVPDNAEIELKTARHEAGHAVCARLLRVPIGTVTLEKHGSGLGKVQGPPKAVERDDPDLAWKHAVVFELGPATEELFYGEPDWNFCQEDHEEVRDRHTKFFQSRMSYGDYRNKIERWAKHILGHYGFREAVDEVARHLVKYRDAQPEWVAEVVDRLCPHYTPPGR